MGNQEKYTYFSVEKVADGIYAALGDVNAGIIDLGDKTLIFDTLATVHAGDELRRAAEQLTGRKATFVINSHAHFDHYHGNLAFADHAVLISSEITRNIIETEGASILERNKNDFLSQAESYRKQLADAKDEAEISNLRAIVDEYDTFLAGYPAANELRVPTLTYDRSITFQGTDRVAKLMSVGEAHSRCDSVLWLPDDGILFVADLVIPGGDLIMYLGEPSKWLPVLDHLETLNANLLIPGHRKIVSAQEGDSWARQYITDIFRQVDTAIANGKTSEDVDAFEVPEGCRANIYRDNLRFLMEQRAQSKIQV